MQTGNTITPQAVDHIADLAHIPVTEDEKKVLAQGFNTVLQVLDKLNSIDVSHVEPTYQVTGLQNIFREDTLDEGRTFTQKQALANAPQSYNGFFVVDRILDKSNE